MVLLRVHLAVALAALLLSGCKFDPAVYGLGYQPCDTTDDCRAGGLVCLKGLCVPDCGEAYTVAWLEPESMDDIGYEFTMMCPSGECEMIAGEEFDPAYLGAALPPSTFLDLGSTKPKVEGCDRVVIRFSILAPETGEPQGLELSVVIRGLNATGVVPRDQDGIITLSKFNQEEDVYKQFRENTYFYVVDTVIFEWPVRLRLVPIANNTVAFFGIRDFEMSCCN
ncbi:hypothetical protein ACFL2F_04110 [Myxococcota bacterium]